MPCPPCGCCCCTKHSKTKGASESVRRPATSKTLGQPATSAASAQKGNTYTQPPMTLRNPTTRPTDRATNTLATGAAATEPRTSGDTGSPSKANTIKRLPPAVGPHLGYGNTGNTPSSNYRPSYRSSFASGSSGKDSGAGHCGGGSGAGMADGGC